MQCYVYRSRRKPGAFLFLPDKDNFKRVPKVLLDIFGAPEFSFDFTLDHLRKMMINVPASEVMRVIEQNGFFLQLPPGEELKSETPN